MENALVTSESREYSGSGDPQRTIDLLWGVQRPRRGPKPRFTVAEVATVAVAIADRDGLAGVSLRRVADELGVTAMSLYGYVPSKAELLDLMAEHAYGDFPLPEPEPGQEWRTRLAEAARNGWSLYLAHPWLLRIATSRPMLGPNLTAKYDYELNTVEGIGLSDVDMDLVISLVSDYVHGAARTAVDAAVVELTTGMTDEQWWESYGPLLGEVLDPERYPVAVRVGSAAGAEYGAAQDPARSFEFGLARLLDGIAAFIGSHA